MKELKTLNRFFIKYKWHLLGGLVFVLLSTLFKIYQGVIVRQGSDDILNLMRTRSGETEVFIGHGVKLILLALISGFFLFMMRQTIIVMSRHIEFDQKNEIFEHYQKMDQRFFKTHTTGDLMNRISEDVGKVRMYTGPAIMYLANTIVTVFTVLIFMLNVNAKLTLMVFLPLPILSVIIYFVSDRINKQSAKVQEELGNLTTQAQETFGAIRVIKAYSRQTHFVEEMQEKSNVYRRAALKLANIEAFFGPTMMLMIGASVLITIWYGGKLTISGEIQAGNIPEFILYVFFMTWPFASLGWVTSLVQRASASQKRINEFLNERSGLVNTRNDEYEINGDIEFRNVSFKYPENNIQALKNVSFSLKAEQVLGITGPVGSGKSSIVALLTRQYDVDEGQILIDGLDIKKHNLDVLRKKFSIVPQDGFLFSDTITNNIAFGSHKQELTKMEIEDLATKAGIIEDIKRFPEAFDTMIGERGVTLSGGQKQRISIARALAADPHVIVFDDCLSAVDTETEELILSNLRKELSKRTGLIISHRVSGFRDADLIIYLKDGAIAESGTHQQLLALNGMYKELYALQNN